MLELIGSDSTIQFWHVHMQTCLGAGRRARYKIAYDTHDTMTFEQVVLVCKKCYAVDYDNYSVYICMHVILDAYVCVSICEAYTHACHMCAGSIV